MSRSSMRYCASSAPNQPSPSLAIFRSRSTSASPKDSEIAAGGAGEAATISSSSHANAKSRGRSRPSVPPASAQNTPSTALAPLWAAPPRRGAIGDFGDHADVVGAVLHPGAVIPLHVSPPDRTRRFLCDVARAFCVGAIPDELHRIHADVLEAFELARCEMPVGTFA